MKPTRCTLLHSIFISTPRCVSGNYVPIVRRTHCIYTKPVFFIVYQWPSGLLLSTFISTSLRVSGNYVPIIRGTHCIYTKPVFFTLYRWPSGLTASNRNRYFSLCIGGCLVCFLVHLFQLLYVFRATMCPSSGEVTESIRNQYFSLCIGGHLVCFLVHLFQLLYVFRATMCPSSGELTTSMRHWYFSLYIDGRLVCRIHSEKYQCRIDAVSSPDDGHIVARNMYRI